MKTFLLKLISLSLSFILSLFLAEIILRKYFPVIDPYRDQKECVLGIVNRFIRSEFPTNYRVETLNDEGLPGIKPHNVFSTNNRGFRGDFLASPKPSDEYRIFILGGSTAECFYLDDADSVNAVLQDRLNKNEHKGKSVVKVYNAGKSGDLSDDHIAMIVHRIVHLEPDLIIVFAGINDMRRLMTDYDYLHYKEVKDDSPRSILLSCLATEFQIPRRIYYLYRHFRMGERESMETLTVKTRYKEVIRLCQSKTYSEVKPNLRIEFYQRNLLTIAGIAQANQIQLLFMTQQSTWNSTVDTSISNWHWMLLVNGIKYREAVLEDLLDKTNDCMRQLSSRLSIPLCDVARTIPKSSRFFYDDCHLNVSGAAMIAENLAAIVARDCLPKFHHQPASEPIE